MQKDTAPKIQWSYVNAAYIVTFTLNGKGKVRLFNTKAEADAFVATLEGNS